MSQKRQGPENRPSDKRPSSKTPPRQPKGIMPRPSGVDSQRPFSGGQQRPSLNEPQRYPADGLQRPAANITPRGAAGTSRGRTSLQKTGKEQRNAPGHAASLRDKAAPVPSNVQVISSTKK